MVQLRFHDELTLKDIAGLLDLAGPQAAANRVEAALASMREMLDVDGEES